MFIIDGVLKILFQPYIDEKRLAVGLSQNCIYVSKTATRNGNDYINPCISSF